MVYIVNYDIKDAERKDTFLNEAKKIGDIFQYLPHAMFLYSTDNSKDQSSIYTQLKHVTTDDDLFIVTRASLSSMSGWLTSSAVDWLKSHK
jgi:hypothetical protein